MIGSVGKPRLPRILYHKLLVCVEYSQTKSLRYKSARLIIGFTIVDFRIIWTLCVGEVGGPSLLLVPSHKLPED